VLFSVLTESRATVAPAGLGMLGFRKESMKIILRGTEVSG
jgi:hypothetical protein